MFDPRNRRAAREAATTLGFREPARLVDRTAIIAGDCVVKAGVYVNAGCIVASAATLGEFAFCNRGANIGHHCKIGAFASIGPGAILAGLVEIGEDSQVGAGAVILPKVRIGAGALVAPGAVVARDVPDWRLRRRKSGAHSGVATDRTDHARLWRRPVVHLYAVCWNEAHILPYFFRNYEPWVQRFVFFDNGST